PQNIEKNLRCSLDKVNYSTISLDLTIAYGKVGDTVSMKMKKCITKNRGFTTLCSIGRALSERISRLTAGLAGEVHAAAKSSLRVTRQSNCMVHCETRIVYSRINGLSSLLLCLDLNGKEITSISEQLMRHFLSYVCVRERE
ncbi:hypothetical protein L9F63_014661, partial [Diploptera punctata]